MEYMMSFFSHPTVARSVARLMQYGTAVGARRMTRSANERLPEFPRHAETLQVPTTFGSTRITAYRPESNESVRPVYVNLHGGGFVLSLTDYDDPICRALAARSGAVVLNVEYVVAPQHPFPAPPHHVYEILQWVVGNGSAHGWDGTRLAIGGQSAGGALAAAAARLVLERGEPAIALQVLHYPPLDLTVPASAKPSPIAKPMLRPWMGEVFDNSYVPDPTDRADRLVSPAGVADTADLTGIAPAVVIAAENDILRDEARRYAERLKQVGSLVEYHEVSGADHGYDVKDDERARSVYSMMASHILRVTSA
jgi:acetyl esterase